MTQLIQNSASLSDCTGLTYSTWIRLNSNLADDPQGFLTLLEFGNPDTVNGISSTISIGASTVDGVTIYGVDVTLAGKSSSYTPDPVGEWGADVPGGPIFDIDVPINGSIVGLTAQVGTSPPLWDLWTAPLSSYPVGTKMEYGHVAGGTYKWRQTAGLRDPINFTCGLRANGNAPAFIAGSWHHLFVSVDLSGGMTNTAIPVMSTNNDGKFVYQDAFMHPVNIYVDNASVLNNSGLGFLTSEDNDGDGSFTTTEELPQGMMPGGFLVRGGSALTNGTGDGAVLSGFPIAFPKFIPSSTDPEASINKVLAYTQFWNKYIAATPENLNAFAVRKIINRQAKIVPPTNKFAAANAFGPPDVYFYRDKKSGVPYQRNNGTAGDFAVVGTMTDFTPGPGQ